MLNIDAKVEEVELCFEGVVPSEILSSDRPLILKKLAANWPVVKAGLDSSGSAADYICSYYNQRPIGAFLGGAEIKGRYFYNHDLSSFNFERRNVQLDEVLNLILQGSGCMDGNSYYVGSATIDNYLPGFRASNDLKFESSEINPLISIWMGNRSRIAAHYDGPNNIACSVVGRRRFTLFPPDQISNLYVGPVDLTPAGQAISMVDFESPDYKKFPRFREALKFAQVADLEPGDAIYLPSMWWHHVEGLSDLNVLVNYWWRSSPNYMGPGINALNQAFLAIRDLPEAERQAWKHVFDYYIFGDNEKVLEHLPESSHGRLGTLDDTSARKVRAMLINGLNR